MIDREWIKEFAYKVKQCPKCHKKSYCLIITTNEFGEEWEDNLPYGALLSVKEAKAQGFRDFTIFFPAKDDSRYAEIKRLKADPIIVAHKKGQGNKMYNIFAWDDGKVYE